MTAKEALSVLDVVTDPRNAHKLSRQDYAASQQALEVLSKLVAADEAAREARIAATANAIPDEPE